MTLSPLTEDARLALLAQGILVHEGKGERTYIINPNHSYDGVALDAALAPFKGATPDELLSITLTRSAKEGVKDTLAHLERSNKAIIVDNGQDGCVVVNNPKVDKNATALLALAAETHTDIAFVVGATVRG